MFHVLTTQHFNDSKLSISAHNGVAFDSFFFLKKMLNSWTALACMGVLWLFVTVVGGELEPSCSHLIIVHQILIIILKRLANLLDHIGHNLSASASGPLLGQSLH